VCYAGIDELFDECLELFARRIDRPQPEAAIGRHAIKKNRNRHHQIDPVGRELFAGAPISAFFRRRLPALAHTFAIPGRDVACVYLFANVVCIR
jgi:hypothetical protein